MFLGASNLGFAIIWRPVQFGIVRDRLYRYLAGCKQVLTRSGRSGTSKEPVSFYSKCQFLRGVVAFKFCLGFSIFEAGRARIPSTAIHTKRLNLSA